MASPELPGLDVSGRIRSRDIQMAGVADVRRRVLLVSGAVDTVDQDVSVVVDLPEPGRWQVIKAETNLTDRTWIAMQVVVGGDSTIVDDDDAVLLSRQFSKSFLTPDQRRVVFYDGEVRPGESVLKVYSLDAGTTRPAYSYSQYSPVTAETTAETGLTIEDIVRDGIPQRPVVELVVPVTVVP
ncbi:DUF6423 family protein [Actinomycetospora atypica]|uniref:DUF6423 family protein n=1 Tax=Actinomycetospora atypica TaxID=1290095 RepID=A0ABV9YQK3_9PSEU